VFMSDPNIAGGQKVQKLVGIVVGREVISKEDGTTLKITGADLGWHLTNNTGLIWKNLNGIKFDALLKLVIDSSWGFQGVRSSNDLNRKLKQGRAGFAASGVNTPLFSILPRIQFEPGETLADVLVRYARREKLLINVSGDGYLQIFQPNYVQPTSY